MTLPSLLDRVQPPGYESVGAEIRAVALSAGAVVIHPASSPSFAASAAGEALVCPDGFHPSAAGQAHYADVLTHLLREAGLA